MKVIVGLGNPEKSYENTRHNIGFMVIDQLAIKYGVEFSSEKKFFAVIAKTTPVAGTSCDSTIKQSSIIAQEEILLVKPTTYMNDSGKAVLALFNWFKPASENILIIHDDVSLSLGEIRFQSGRGAGGQHGIESILSLLPVNTELSRLKIGVGPDPGGALRAQFVLSNFSLTEEPIVKLLLPYCRDAVSNWITCGIDQSMNKYNRKKFILK